MQIEKTYTRKEVNKKEQAVIDTLQLTSEICSQRNFSGLFKKICQYMPAYFGFEAVGAMIYDQESGNLFADAEIYNDPPDEEDPDNVTDEDDDFKLTDNVKQTLEMPKPKLSQEEIDKQKAAKRAAFQTKKQKKASKKELPEPLTKQQRLEALHE